ncbi:MAG: NAD(P)-dependent oxidoreductase [Haloferacaceae archaeon]
MSGTGRPLEALLDRDIKPKETLIEGVGDAVDVEVGGASDEDALIEDLEGKEMLYTTSRLPVTERVLREADSLRFIGKFGTGLDTLDLAAAERHGVTVTYTPGLNASSVAEMGLTLLLAVRRNVAIGERALDAGKWRDEVPNARLVSGTSVGIVGFGNVGSRLAGLLDGFNADVYTHDPYVHEIDTEITGATLTDLETTLSKPDAVVVCAEHTDETRGMMDADAFEAMRSSAVLVNVARGPIVDTAALVDALASGAIAGAGLDVFETEPLPPDHRLHDFENVVTTPHIAGSTFHARSGIIETLVSVTNDYLDGREIPERFVAARPA